MKDVTVLNATVTSDSNNADEKLQDPVQSPLFTNESLNVGGIVY